MKLKVTTKTIKKLTEYLHMKLYLVNLAIFSNLIKKKIILRIKRAKAKTHSQKIKIIYVHL